MNAPLYKKIQSYFYPIRFENKTSEHNKILELFLFQNEWMLTTPDAIYSHGLHYTPFKYAFKSVRHELKNVKTFLLLGAGLGSAVQILNKNYGIFPQTMLVDNDDQVIAFGKKIYQQSNQAWVLDDASNFIENCEKTFDLIGVDVFHDLHVPRKITERAFLKTCAERLSKRGIMIMNYVVHHSIEEKNLCNHLNEIFVDVQTIYRRQNVFFICKNY
jgi:spermidine synthase